MNVNRENQKGKRYSAIVTPYKPSGALKRQGNVIYLDIVGDNERAAKPIEKPSGNAKTE